MFDAVIYFSAARCFRTVLLSRDRQNGQVGKKAAHERWGLRLMKLIVAVHEANESEPRVKLLGNHNALKKIKTHIRHCDTVNSKQMQK